MANLSLHHESARATGEQFNMHTACLAAEDVQASAEALASILWLMSRAEDLPETVHNALRGCEKLAQGLAVDCGSLASRCLESHKAVRQDGGSAAELH